MEQGPTEQFIIKQCIQQKLPLPDPIANAPELYLGLELYYRAFLELNSCRSVGFGEGGISWTSVIQWAIYNGLNRDQTDRLYYFISKMDSVYLEYRLNEQRKRRSDGKPDTVRGSNG